jgi:hypothetical protein
MNVVSITRREAFVGLAFACTVTSFRAEAASAGFGVLVDAIGETITQSAKVISAVTEQLNKAVSDGIDIYDKLKLVTLRETLDSIKGQMSSLNGGKKANIEAAKDYLDKKAFADSWLSIQKQWKDISLELDALLTRLGSDDTVLVKGTDLATAGDLKAALLRQSSIYLRLSTLQEPSNDDERKKIASVIKKLSELLKNVVVLESSIKAYLENFH